MNPKEIKQLLQELMMPNRDMLDAFVNDMLFDLEFVNEKLAEIPDKWEPID